jgi:hypothetical protein
VVLDALVQSRLATTSVRLQDTLWDFGLLASFFSAFRDGRRRDVAATSATTSCHTPRIIPGKRAPESPTQEVLEIDFSTMRRRFVPQARIARSGAWQAAGGIERVGAGPRGGELVSVAHYGELNGDLMRDPEIVFEVIAGSWHPVSIQMDYTGSYREAVFVGEGGKVNVRPALVRDIVAVARFGTATSNTRASLAPRRPWTAAPAPIRVGIFPRRVSSHTNFEMAALSPAASDGRSRKSSPPCSPRETIGRPYVWARADTAA